MSTINLAVKVILFCMISTLIILYVGFKPHYATSLNINGETVTISRDEFNIPTVHAPSFSSMMYAWGYITAEDRLFQISFRRMIGKGRLSELIGEKGIKIDKLFRELNFHGWADKSTERFEAENKTQYNNFQFYAQGINDHVSSLIFYPLQFHLLGLGWEKWTVNDIMLLYKVLKWSQSQNMAEQYVRSSLLKKYSKQQVDQMIIFDKKNWMQGQFSTLQNIVKDSELNYKTIPVDEEQWSPEKVQEMLKVGIFDYLDTNQKGSNSWIISGKYTESGHPLLANDPHLDSALPGQWHQVRLYYMKNGKQHKIIGGAMTGLPSFLGQTSYISIGITTIHCDSQDLYKQTINEKGQYLLDGVWRKMNERTETIKVKGGEDVKLTLYETHRGPMISLIPHASVLYEVKQNLSLSWPGFTNNQFRILVEYSHIAQVESQQGFIQILDKHSEFGPTMNIMYITKDDKFGYQSVGSHPLRSNPQHGMYVKDGSTSKYDWKGFLKGKEKLSLANPERGYIVSANNQPASEKFQNGLFGISMFTARADRLERLIREKIQKGEKFTKEDMKNMQGDTVDAFCLEIVKSMNERIKEDKQKYQKVFGNFANFDCDFTSTSTTSTIYIVFLRKLYDEIYPIQSKQFNLATPNFDQYLYRYIRQAQTHQQLLVLESALEKTQQKLKDYFKTENKSKYIYGDFHKDMMIHRPFSQSKILKPFFQQVNKGWGNFNTPNVGILKKLHEQDYGTYHRANIRTIMSYYEECEWVVDGGTSEKFFSKHYIDQLPLFLNMKYLPMEQKSSKRSQKNEDL